jgi:sulfur carrier protein ThiS
MATVSTAKRSIEVTLYRPGAGMQAFTLPEGATLADLLREAGIPPSNPSLLINGQAIEAAVTLQPGVTITILPEPPGTPRRRSWRDTVGMFADDPTFEEAVAAGRAIREADRQAAREEAAREQS